MSLLPPCFIETKTLRLARGILFACMGGAMALHGAESIHVLPPAVDDGAIPQALKEEVFEALVTNPPFTRSLGISDSLILTGVARFEQDVFATLLDTKTMESHVVSRTANFQGWQLVGVGGNPAEIQTCLARIQVPGGEVVSIRYQKPPPKTAGKLAGGGSGGSSSGGSSGSTPPLSSSQASEAKQAAVNYREGFSSDGYPRQPPPEMVAKLSRLSVSQREEINRQMIGHSNQGLGLTERRKIYENLVDRAGQGTR